MAEKIAAPKGTYDVLPAQQPLRRWIVSCAEDVFRLYGYRRVDTPVFEETRLFSRGVGDSTDIVRKEMYTFLDLGGRSMTLRPEGTAPVARAYVEHGMHTLAQPVKLYYQSPMFRYESPQSGRYRQHHQLGVEAIGSPAAELDAEVIGVLKALYDKVGLRDVTLRLNSMGCKECRPAYSLMLRRYLADESASLCADCQQRTTLNPLRVYDCKVASCRERLVAAPRLTDHLCESCAAHHERVQECLAIQEIAYETDHTLVRGMDYYTRTTFEFTASCLGAQSGVGGGGRYDELIESIGGPAVPGVGFGTGLERIILALTQQGVPAPLVDAPIAYVVALVPDARTEAFTLAHRLRTLGVTVELDHAFRSARGQMSQAGRCGARFALILGDEEMATNTVTVRDLGSGQEEKADRQEIASLATRLTGIPSDKSQSV